jgi:hypothetical protein
MLTSTAKCLATAGAGWNRWNSRERCGVPSLAPSSSGRRLSSANPASLPDVCRRCSAAAHAAAAMAPADVPPMFLKRYLFDSSAISLGYTTPLVMPPFITRSHCGVWFDCGSFGMVPWRAWCGARD